MSGAYEAVKEQAKKLIADHHGIVRTKELQTAGISYKQVLRLVADGTMVRAKSGYYTLREKSYSEEELLVSLFRDCVLTMDSALYVHGYIGKKPNSWQLAVSKNTSKTRFVNSPVAVEPYYTEERVLPIGSEEISLEELMKVEDNSGADITASEKPSIRIYGIDRLICDVLKYEEKLEREDFKAAVRTYINDPHKDVAKLLSYAKERKVHKKVQTMIGVWL